MSQGITIIGADITMVFGGAELQGVVTKDLGREATFADTTDDQSSGWLEQSAQPTSRKLSLGFSGKLKNLELVQAFYGDSLSFATTITYPDGSTEVGDFSLDSFNTSGESLDGSTFDASCSSSGIIVFTAGT